MLSWWPLQKKENKLLLNLASCAGLGTWPLIQDFVSSDITRKDSSKAELCPPAAHG